MLLLSFVVVCVLVLRCYECVCCMWVLIYAKAHNLILNTGVGNGGCVVGISAGHEYVGGTRGWGIVSSAVDLLGLNVVRGMKRVGGICEMCMCLAVYKMRGWVDKRIWFGLHQSCWNRGSVGIVSVFGLQWCRWCRWGVGLDQDLEVVLCLCEVWVWILCVDGRSRYLYIVLGEYLRILDAPRVQS